MFFVRPIGFPAPPPPPSPSLSLSLCTQRKKQSCPNTLNHERILTHTDIILYKLTTGYVQTPGWTHFTDVQTRTVPFSMDRWINVSVPKAHHAMVTALDVDMIELPKIVCGRDRLELWVSMSTGKLQMARFCTFFMFTFCWGKKEKKKKRNERKRGQKKDTQHRLIQSQAHIPAHSPRSLSHFRPHPLLHHATSIPFALFLLVFGLRKKLFLLFSVSSFRPRCHRSSRKCLHALHSVSQLPPPPSLPSKIALETVLMFLRLNADCSWPQAIERRALTFSIPLSFRRSVLWCSGLSMVRTFSKTLSTFALPSCWPVFVVSAVLANLSALLVPLTPAWPGQ